MAIHHTRLKKAKGLIGELTDVSEITKLLLENEFSEDEISEILNTQGAGDSEKVKTHPAPPAYAKKPASIHFEEWKCEVKINRVDGKEVSREPEKIKKLRPCVKISDQEAETLNEAALYSPRTDHVTMYFKSE